MTLYGLYGFTHGWARVLTIMSPAGAEAVRKALIGAENVEVAAGSGGPVLVQERREGALARLVEVLDIAVLTREEWRETKQRLDDAIR